MLSIQFANQQTILPVDEGRLRQAVRGILQEASLDKARISVAIVDDPTIHQLNRQYLRHDWPTDVLSFVLGRGAEGLEGQIVASAETAAAQAARFGWTSEDELLLYVIHGTLHLVGVEDKTPSERAQMRRREARCLAQFGLAPHWREVRRPDRPNSGGNRLP